MTLTRNLILMILLSFAVTFWTGASEQVIHFIQHAFSVATQWLSINIGGYVLGEIARHTIALVVIPLLAGLAIHFLFWIIKKQSSGMMTWVMWCVWLVLATILLAK